MRRRLTRWALACGVGVMGGLACGCEPSQPEPSLEAARDTSRNVCSEEILYDRLVERQGLYYEAGCSNPFTGRAIVYHKNGQREAEINWKDGKQHGFLEEYYKRSGKLERFK